MYFKIALRNVKRSMKDYAIYFLTLTFGICLFYMFNSIHSQQAILKLNENQREIIELIQSMIRGLSVFIAVILGLLVVYANQFLMKRRKKEMGIYILLGMEKQQVSRILVIETLFIGIFALVAGLAAGIFLSQGLSVLTAKMLVVTMKEFGFIFSLKACLQTIVYFGLIFFVVMIFNGITISKYKLIDLLNAAKKNEKLKVKKLWVSVVLFLISIICLGTAYYCIQKNGMMQIDNYFRISIILGIVGTFLFFLSLSGFLLRIVKSSKKFYYSGLHMFVLRQINSKITTAFISMSMLCLMLFLAISAFSTGTGLADTFKQDIEDSTLFDYSFYDYKVEGKEKEDSNYIIKQLKKDGIDVASHAKTIMAFYLYQNTDEKSKELTMSPMIAGREEKIDMPGVEKSKIGETKMGFMSLSDYNKILKIIGKSPLKLKDDQYAISCNFENMQDIYIDAIKDKQKLKLAGKKLVPYSKMLTDSYVTTTTKMDTGTIIIADELLKKLNVKPVTNYVNINWKSSDKDYSNKFDKILEKKYGKNTYQGNAPYMMTVSREGVYEQNAGLSALVTYISIYIGIVFLITSAAVLALQQLSENADNISKYDMLQKIGTDEKMIHKSILIQIIIYFMIPLSLALVHSYFGVTVVSKMVSVLGHIDILGATIKSLIVILAIYGGYMTATYLGSKNMLKGK